MKTEPRLFDESPQFEYWVVNKDRSVDLTVPFKAMNEQHAQDWIDSAMRHSSDYYHKHGGGLEIIKRRVTRCTGCGQVVEAKKDKL